MIKLSFFNKDRRKTIFAKANSRTDEKKQNKNQSSSASLLAKKAFVLVNLVFLFQISSEFDFHPSFINTIQALYNKPKARVKINGALLDSLDLKIGTRQGCQMSLLSFALFIEPLSQGITKNN